MMGAGKSAVGQALAERLDRDFVDTDRAIEAAEGRSVAAIFEEEGEAAFRVKERETVERLAGAEFVVALGGGAIAQPGMSKLLADSGTVVYIRADVSTLVGRVEGRESRPLLAGLDAAAIRARLEELLEQRREAYETASVWIDTGEGPVSDVVGELMLRLAADSESARVEERAGDDS